MCRNSVSVSTSTSGAQKRVQDPVGLKFQAIMNCLPHMLGTKLRCSARVASALCWAIYPAQICVFYAYIYTFIYFLLDTEHEIQPRNISRKHVKSQNKIPFEAHKMHLKTPLIRSQAWPQWNFWTETNSIVIKLYGDLWQLSIWQSFPQRLNWLTLTAFLTRKLSFSYHQRT